MAYTVKTEGIQEISQMLKSVGEKADAIASSGLYDGAGVMADEIQKGAEGIQAGKFHYAVFPEAVQRLPSEEEKAAVVNADMGIAKFRKGGGEVNTSVGYGRSGYVLIKGKRKPIPLIANAINSGTSFMKKQPFFRKAVTKATEPSIAKIKETIEGRIDALTKQNGGTNA